MPASLLLMLLIIAGIETNPGPKRVWDCTGPSSATAVNYGYIGTARNSVHMDAGAEVLLGNVAAPHHRVTTFSISKKRPAILI